MFAVGRRVAVTAAHCVAGLDPREMTLLFGYDRMGWRSLAKPSHGADIGSDVAVLCLQEDAPASRGIGTAGVGDSVTVVGYGSPVTHRQRPIGCRVAATSATEIALDCAQAPGASGAPVLNGRGEAVAVTSRTGAAVSLAARLPPDIADRCP